MLKKERQAFILPQVNLHNRVLFLLSQEINVLEDTLRRDLQELADEVYYPTYNIYSQDQKKIIAKKTASLIGNGMFVLASGGTAIIEMARALPPRLKATFVSATIP
jgi:DeoR/GlpR family transcriptional regulator of sugar metabolism